MKITQAAVEQLAAEIERQAGRNPVESISRPGDGRTHYVMAESMTSTYRGARLAAAYLLGVLAGLDPEGPVHWVATMPAWVQAIDGEFRYGQIGQAALAANHAGRAWGKTLRPTGNLITNRRMIMRFLKVHRQLAVNPAAITRLHVTGRETDARLCATMLNGGEIVLSHHKDFSAAEDALATVLSALNAHERREG